MSSLTIDINFVDASGGTGQFNTIGSAPHREVRSEHEINKRPVKQFEREGTGVAYRYGHKGSSEEHSITHGVNGEVVNHSITKPKKIATVRGPQMSSTTQFISPQESEQKYAKLHKQLRSLPKGLTHDADEPEREHYIARVLKNGQPGKQGNYPGWNHLKGADAEYRLKLAHEMNPGSKFVLVPHGESDTREAANRSRNAARINRYLGQRWIK